MQDSLTLVCLATLKLNTVPVPGVVARTVVPTWVEDVSDTILPVVTKSVIRFDTGGLGVVGGARNMEKLWKIMEIM